MKTALITGGSGTIGMAIAKSLLLTNQFSVILTGRNSTKLDKVRCQLLSELKLQLEEANNNKEDDYDNVVRVIPNIDVSKEDSVVSMFRRIDRMGKIDEKKILIDGDDSVDDDDDDDDCGTTGVHVDLLINNAGITNSRPMEELTAKDMEDVLGVNVIGAFLCSREAIKRMKQRKKRRRSKSGGESGGGGYDNNDVVDDDGGIGRIINVGSISSISPRLYNSTAYTTSKFALAGLTRSLALDCRRDTISVGIINPGNVRSELLSQEEIERREMSEGFINPDDVAKCVLTMATLPYTASVLEMTVIPTRQPLVGRG